MRCDALPCERATLAQPNQWQPMATSFRPHACYNGAKENVKVRPLPLFALQPPLPLPKPQRQPQGYFRWGAREI